MGKVSFSQYSIWKSCPYRWKLLYIDKLIQFKDNINLLFGSAIHFVLQKYLKTLYNLTESESNKLNLSEELSNKMIELYKKITCKENFKEFTNNDEFYEYYLDGVEILKYFKDKRSVFFSKRNWSLLGIESPLNIKLVNEVNFIGFLDIIIKNNKNNIIKIIDFKTSTKGWDKYQKNDKVKMSQLLLYKGFYSRKYNVPLDNIEVEFIILKRKLNEEFLVYGKRINTFSPKNNEKEINKVLEEFDLFIKDCFDEGGKYITKEYKKNVSKYSCMFCEFNNNVKICDKNEI